MIITYIPQQHGAIDRSHHYTLKTTLIVFLHHVIAWLKHILLVITCCQAKQSKSNTGASNADNQSSATIDTDKQRDIISDHTSTTDDHEHIPTSSPAVHHKIESASSSISSTDTSPSMSSTSPGTGAGLQHDATSLLVTTERINVVDNENASPTHQRHSTKKEAVKRQKRHLGSDNNATIATDANSTKSTIPDTPVRIRLESNTGASNADNQSSVTIDTDKQRDIISDHTSTTDDHEHIPTSSPMVRHEIESVSSSISESEAGEVHSSHHLSTSSATDSTAYAFDGEEKPTITAHGTSHSSPCAVKSGQTQCLLRQIPRRYFLRTFMPCHDDHVEDRNKNKYNFDQFNTEELKTLGGLLAELDYVHGNHTLFSKLLITTDDIKQIDAIANWEAMQQFEERIKTEGLPVITDDPKQTTANLHRFLTYRNRRNILAEQYNKVLPPSDSMAMPSMPLNELKLSYKPFDVINQWYSRLYACTLVGHKCIPELLFQEWQKDRPLRTVAVDYDKASMVTGSRTACSSASFMRRKVFPLYGYAGELLYTNPDEILQFIHTNERNGTHKSTFNECIIYYNVNHINAVKIDYPLAAENIKTLICYVELIDKEKKKRYPDGATPTSVYILDREHEITYEFTYDTLRSMVNFDANGIITISETAQDTIRTINSHIEDQRKVDSIIGDCHAMSAARMSLQLTGGLTNP